MGRSFPNGKAFFESERTSIPNLLAAEQADVASKHARGDTKCRYRFPEQHFYAEARQKPPIRFNERTA